MKKPATLLFIFLLLALVLYKLISQESVWDGKTRLTIIFSRTDSPVPLVILDPDTRSRTTIHIPENTQVNVAHQLGIWKLGSVGKLGEQEGLNGQLLSDSVMKSFNFPLDAWVSEEGRGLLSSNPVSLLKSLFTPYKSNLSFKDKLKLIWFSLHLKASNNIFLEKTGYLEKARLTSGEDGYLIKKTMPIELEHLFSVKSIADENARISIQNASGSDEISQLSSVIDVLGTKVVSLKKEEPKDIDCQILTKDAGGITIRFLSRIFRCEILKNQEIGNFDFEIVLGSEFARRF